MAKTPKRKAGKQNPKPPKQLIAKNPPTGLPAIGDVPTTTVAEDSPSQEPLASTSFPLNTTPSTVPDVVGMDVDFSTPQVSAHGLATGGQPGPSFQASSSISHELPTSLIQSHETTLTANYPPGPPSAYPTSGATPPMSEKGKSREDRRERSIQESSSSINQSLSAVGQVASSNYGFRRLHCLVEGDSVVFTVITPFSFNISELKELIQKERELSILKDVGPHTLKLLKVDVDLNAQTRDSLRHLKLEPRGEGVEELVEWKSVSGYWSMQPTDERLHIFVKLQADHVISSLPPTTQILEMETTDIQPYVTLETINRGEFGGADALELNNITALDVSDPEFLMAFRAKLKQHRWVTPNNAAILKSAFTAFDGYFEEKSMETPDDGTKDRWADAHEMWHLAGAFLNNGWRFHQDIKEENMRMDFDQLAWYFESILAGHGHGIHTEWPLRLLVHVQSDNKNYRYTPRSDFYLSVNGLPYLILEVQSETNGSNRHRMLLQAACLARLGNGLTPNTEEPFIVTALYIESSGRMERYLVFSPDRFERKVFYVMDARQLYQSAQLFEALFEIYNLASVVRNDQSLIKGAQSRIPKLKKEILDNFKDTFTGTKRTRKDDKGDETGSTERARTNHGNHGRKASDIQHGEDVYESSEVAEAFATAGYALESNGEDEHGWAPLNELRPSMRHARHPDGTAVVVKLVRARSNELSLLQYLGSISSACNHTIPLLGTLNLSVGTFIMIPEATPLDLGSKLGHFHGKVTDLSQQLVDGVAFLHENGVAHLDIKPGNIVVARRNHLYIIDLDISVRVDGPDELIDKWVGSPPWMAPEIGDLHGSKRLYSPIRADLWSCGLVLRYLASKRGKEDDTFETLAGQLLNKDPWLRPMLSSSSSGKATDVSTNPHHELKRKRDTACKATGKQQKRMHSPGGDGGLM